MRVYMPGALRYGRWCTNTGCRACEVDVEPEAGAIRTTLA